LESSDAAEPEAVGESDAVTKVEVAAALAGQREAAAGADARGDDLERIEGIGPQMSGALLVAGIRTYEQLASTDQATLRRAIEARGLKFAPSLVTWAQQAQLLADGDEEGFADLTRRLVAGRDEGRL
jgi:predicted flap endonuclease-1-like 5' DNA nuclease